MDCSPAGSSVHGIFQARILEWVAIPFSRGSSQPRNQTCIVGGSITAWATKEAQLCSQAFTWVRSITVESEHRFPSSLHAPPPASREGECGQKQPDQRQRLQVQDFPFYTMWINSFKIKTTLLDFPGIPVVKKPPVEAGDTGLIPGLGRSHKPWLN